MGFISAAVSVAFLIYLILRISRMVWGTTTVVSTAPAPGLPDLPDRSKAEVNALLASMPTAWVTYEGMTPPLQLKLRGLTHELYRRFTTEFLDAYGRQNFDHLPQHEIMEVMMKILPDLNASAYVLDWKGATYTNGNPLPYTRDNMASLMRKDEMLRNFVSDQAGKIGPGW